MKELALNFVGMAREGSPIINNPAEQTTPAGHDQSTQQDHTR